MTSFIDETDSRLPADLSPDEKFRFVMTFNGAIDTRMSEHEALNLALESLRTPESRMPADEEVVSRHFGPGDHPGTGTPQQAHAGAGASRGSETSPDDFHSAFEAAFRDNKYSGHVTHHSVDDLGTMTALLMTEDGKAGVAVQDHGDGRIEATALFNQGGPPGAGIALLRQAIAEHGVNYVEAFGPYLPKLYETLGFEVVERFPFDREQAPPDWRYNLYGEPDYFTMRLQ